VGGNTSRANADYSPSGTAIGCTGFVANGNDLVYSFTPATAGTYQFTLTPTGFDGALYLLDQCPAAPDNAIATCLGGSDQPRAGVAEVVTAALAANAPVFIVVDGYAATDLGAFTLEVTSGPANDRCDAPVTLTAGVPVTGDTTLATNDYTPDALATGCPAFSETGPDLAYAFTPAASGTYRFSLSRLSPSFDAAIYLVDHCPAAGAPISACVGGEDLAGPGVAETFTAALTANTAYTLIVDGFNNSKGAFAVQVDAVVPPANDSCAAPQALTLNTSVSGDSSAGSNDYAPTAAVGCTGTDNPGLDVVYSFTPANTGDYRFRTTGAALGTTLYLLDSCPASGASIAQCHAGSANGTLRATLTASTTYFVVVDSSVQGAGAPFTLEVDVAPPVPANDLCASAIPVTAGTPVTGDTTTATNDYSPAQGATHCTTFAETGPDLVYVFTPQTTGRYKVSLTQSAPGFDAALYVLSSCPSGPVTSCLGGSDQVGNLAPEGVSLNMTAGQPYYLVVDGFGSAAGAFTLAVDPTTPGPTNDSCSAPLALTAGTPVSVDTTNATDDLDPDPGAPGCAATSGAGLDAVYSFTPATAGSYTFTLSAATPGTTGTFYLLDTCPTAGASLASCLGGATLGNGTSREVALRLLAHQTYFVVVDGAATDASGVYQLSVDATATPPANDDCSAAEVLTLGTVASGDSTRAASDFGFGATACGTVGAADGADVVYVFTPATTDRYTVTVSAPTLSTYSPVLYALSACPAASESLPGCLAGAGAGFGTETDLTLNLTAGTPVYLVVDSASAGGAFTIGVIEDVVPANDTCQTATPIAPGGTATGSTLSAAADYATTATSCSPDGSAGPDVVYSFTAPATKAYTFTVTPGAGYDAVLYVETSCPFTAAQACPAGKDQGGAGAAEALTLNATQGTTYFVVVDGWQTSSGAYTLTVSN
jgi:hypothetical protein